MSNFTISREVMQDLSAFYKYSFEGLSKDLSRILEAEGFSEPVISLRESNFTVPSIAVISVETNQIWYIGFRGHPNKDPLNPVGTLELVLNNTP